MMSRLIPALFLLTGLIATGCKDDDDDTPATANTVELTATLSGAQQVPAVTSSGTGAFSGTYNRDTRVLTYSVTYSGLSAAPVAGHIHLGSPGKTGQVRVPFASVATSPITGTVTFAAADTAQMRTVELLLSQRAYVNLHTTANPSGEIRGNIRPK